MKTTITTILSLIFAVIFSVSVMAQNNNYASSTQSGTGNEVTVDQVGDDHFSTVDQLGDGNISYINQTADAGREGDDIGTATVEQTGDGNIVNLNQRSYFGNSEAYITQTGDGNLVTGPNGSAFLQNHGNNVLVANMTGDDNTLYALSGEAQKNANYFRLNITGDENSVGMFQHFGTATVDIDGNNNESVVNQRSNSPSSEAIADVDMVGNDNLVDVFQTNGGLTGASNEAYVSQYGDSNVANVYQNGTGNSTVINQGSGLQ